MNYIQYDETTGEILSWGTTMEDLPIEPILMLEEPFDSDSNTMYVLEGVLTPRPDLPFSLDETLLYTLVGTTLILADFSGTLPKNASLLEEPVEILNEYTILALPFRGVYKFVLKNFPYVDKEFEIHV